MKIVLLSEEGMLRFVADDSHFDALFHRRPEEIEHAWVGLSVDETWTINVALHLGPVRLLTDLAQVIANGCFILWQRSGDETTLQSHTVKDTVVADNRVVEINADDHAGRRSVSIRLATPSAVRP